jgi:hypothetical protein
MFCFMQNDTRTKIKFCNIIFFFVKCFVLYQLHKEENKNKTFEFEIS